MPVATQPILGYFILSLLIVIGIIIGVFIQLLFLRIAINFPPLKRFLKSIIQKALYDN